MIANQVQTYILSNASLPNLQAALDLLRNGQALTNVQSGVVAIPAGALGAGTKTISDLPWRLVWDGTHYTLFIFVTAG